MGGLTLVRWLGAVVAVQATVATAMTFGPPSPSSSSSESKVLGVTVSGKDKVNGNDKKTILAGGTVPGLYPGAVAELPVLLENPNNFDVVVTDIRVTVTQVSVACPAANLRVEDFAGSRLVPRDGNATQALVARMRNDAPNECKNAEWRLDFDGRAEKPDKS